LEGTHINSRRGANCPSENGTSERWQRARHRTHNRDDERSSSRHISGELLQVEVMEGRRIITVG
jgi:hypothetical protein